MKSSKFLIFLLLTSISTTVDIDVSNKNYSYKAYAQTSGCGSGRSWWAVRVFTPVSQKQFRVACNQHDQCYDTYGKSKQECDKAFELKMRDTCKRDHNTFLGSPLREKCLNIADAYYSAALKHGGPAYRDAQAKAKAKRQRIDDVSKFPQVVTPIERISNKHLSIDDDLGGAGLRNNLILAHSHLTVAETILRNQGIELGGQVQRSINLSDSQLKEYIRKAPEIINQLRLNNDISNENLIRVNRLLSSATSYMGFPHTLKEYWKRIDSDDKSKNSYRVFLLASIIRQRVGLN